MKTLRRKVMLSVSVNPELGTYIHLCRSVRGSDASRRNILQLFNEFMGREEYDKEEKTELIDYLFSQSQNILI